MPQASRGSAGGGFFYALVTLHPWRHTRPELLADAARAADGGRLTPRALLLTPELPRRVLPITLGAMHSPHEVTPECGVCRQLARASAESVLFANELWHVRASEPPTAVPGWMMLITRRHVPGPAAFDDREAASFGPTLRHLQRVLLEVTGALRIYTAAMGESSPHFHAHLVPRYATMPKSAKAWGVFDLQRAAAAREIEVDEAAATRMATAYAQALSKAAPPRP